MKKLTLFFVVLLLAVGLGVLMHNNPASVFITMGHTVIQASLWFAIIAFLIVIFLAYHLVNLLRGVFHIPSRLRHFMAERAERKLHELTRKALNALLEGDWKESEIYFRKSAAKEPYAFFDYVAAAQSAFELNNSKNVAVYLKKAKDIVEPSEALALEIIQVRWQLAAKEYQSALVALQKLQQVSPNHPFILNGLKEVYLASKDWQRLQKLLPQLKETGLDQVAFDALEQRVLSALLDQSSLSELEKNWEEIPKKWRSTPQFLAIYVKHLIAKDQHNKAEKILNEALKKHRDVALLEQYARVNSKDSVKQLSRAEVWLKQDDRNPDLLFCLGSLCARHRLWGKAKTYLEMSLKYKPRPEIYPVLGEVLERLEQKYAALDCYKTGLAFLQQFPPINEFSSQHEKLLTKQTHRFS